MKIYEIYSIMPNLQKIAVSKLKVAGILSGIQ